MTMTSRNFPMKTFAVMCALEVALVGGLWFGMQAEMNRMNVAVDDLSELSDPSPFRAALMGYLGKIHLGLEGFFQSSDAALIDPVAQSRKDFETSLPEFKKQSPRLFPDIAVDEIGKGFTTFQEAIEHALKANNGRVEQRSKIDHNFNLILQGLDKDIRPLIRDSQPDGAERKEAVLQIENQARAWQQNIARAWAQPSDKAKELTFENDNRGQTYLERYARLELLPRERKVLRTLRELWNTNSDLARESFAIEKVVGEAKTFMDSQRNQIVSALNKYLPALPPAEMEARKQRHVRSIRLHLAAAFTLGLGILTSLILMVLGTFRLKRGESLLPQNLKKRGSDSAVIEPTLQMDLKGKIIAWSAAAESLYGYTAQEMKGKLISRLFESESDIERLYKDLMKAPQTTFDTTHKAKSGVFFRVRIEFRPLEDAAGRPTGIGLFCSRK